MPSFWSGVARLVDLWGVFDGYNESRTPAEADARAMYADWAVTGGDISDAYYATIHPDGQQELFPAPKHA